MQIKKLLPVALAAAASAQEMMNLTAALGSSPDLSQLTTTLGLFEELVAQLAQTPNITLLAPSNQAFEALMSDPAAAAILNQTDVVQALLQYHVLNGTYFAANVTETPSFIPTLLMNETYTNVTGGQVVEAIAMEDSVMFITGLLMNSTVTTADIAYDNGVVHVIDSFLTIPLNTSTTAVAFNLTSLVGALTAAELVEAVDTTPDVTIFAPSNMAFQNIGSALANATTEMLTDILTYHVVAGTVGYSSMLMNTTLETLQGESVTISIVDGNVYVNSAMVITPDVLVANGVVHVIDNVLNPMNATATADPSMETQEPAFGGASSASDVPFTSGVPTPTSMAGGEETAASSTSEAKAAMPMKTGAMGAAALFGGAALVYHM